MSKIFIGRKQVAHPVINAIANNAERVVDKQLRNIPAIAFTELLPASPILASARAPHF